MAYDFVPFTKDRLAEVLEIERTLWSQDGAANRAYFTWKYEQSPILDRIYMYLAVSRGEVVGVRGFFGNAWWVDEARTSVITPTGGDTVVVPDHRNRLLFEKMNHYAFAQLARDGVAAVCNFSGGPTTYLRSLRSGWRTLGPYVTVVRKRSLGDANRRTPLAGIEIESAPRPEAMAALVRRLDDPAAIRLQRDRAFFEWRFRNPLSSYVFLFATESGELTGFMALQERMFRQSKGMRIADWEATDRPTFARLLDAAINEVDAESLSIWSATLPSSVLSCLVEAGFERINDTKGSRRYKPGPLVAVIGSAASEPWRLGEHRISDLENWQLRPVCSDSF